MHTWQSASLLYFGYCLGVISLRRLPARQARIRAAALSMTGLALTVLSLILQLDGIFADWIVPPALLLIGYWATGAMFVAPMPRVERLLAAVDRRLGIRALAASTPRPVVQLLEAAYAAVYALVPAALVLQFVYLPGADPARFWSVILCVDYICFGFLPWIQTRPPRALEAAAPWSSSVRRFNERLLGTASIQANTFPSGHAAEALAAALLVSTLPWPIAAFMALAALAVSAGAVLGRYHYALDALAGWAVALLVWAALK